VYGSYWNRVLEHWTQRRLDEPKPSNIQQLVEQVKGQRLVRRNGRGGRSAAEHLVAALRCLYNHAVTDGYLAEADNPARAGDQTPTLAHRAVRWTTGR
jgi:integrase/recombinase XerC